MSNADYSFFDVVLLFIFPLLCVRFSASRGFFGQTFAFISLVLAEDLDDDVSPIGFPEALKIWRKILWLAYPEFKYMALALLASLCQAICSFSHPLFMGRAIDLASEAVKDPTSTNIAEVTKQLSAIFTTIVALEIINSLASYGHERFNNNVGDFVRQNAQVRQNADLATPCTAAPCLQLRP